MFSYVSPEQRLPRDHPLRRLRPLVGQLPRKLSPRFARMRARVGRPSIPPEKLLRALLLQVLYTMRNEREASLEMIPTCSGPGHVTVGADKNYDTREWVKLVHGCGATPHVAQNNKNRSSAIDARTTQARE